MLINSSLKKCHRKTISVEFLVNCCFTLVVLLLFVSSPIFASGKSTGDISGVVTIQTQGVFTVTITNPSTGFTRFTNLSDGESFRFSKLPVARYRVEISDENGNVLATNNANVTIDSTIDASFVLDFIEEDEDTITVTGRKYSGIDLTAIDRGLIIDEERLDLIPIERDSTSVALLAPTTTRGDSAFGNLASFSGASVAENIYYVNGLNITSFRKGLAGSIVPFEFYEQYQVKTGGYGAEFGRSLGGVINAVTKRGTNEFQAGANLYHTVGDWQGSSPNSYAQDGSLYQANDLDKIDRQEMNIWISGPVVEDKLFYYLLYNPQQYQAENVYARGNYYSETNFDDAFWGAKLDWQINNNHLLELLAFSDQETGTNDQYSYDYTNRQRGDWLGVTYGHFGGQSRSLKYTGYITDDLTASVLVGRNEFNSRIQSPNDISCPVVVDLRESATELYPGCWVNGITASDFDLRDQYRLDFEYDLNVDHRLRFGLDREILTSEAYENYSGGIAYFYYTIQDGGSIGRSGEFNNTGMSQDYVRLYTRTFGGVFETEVSAFYLEDLWQVTDDLFLSLGLRNETFKNKNADGEVFIEQSDQLAPRLSATWDIGGYGESKLYTSFGQYYIPVANNTNVRVGGAVIFGEEWYSFSAIDPETSIPTLDTQYGGDTFGDYPQGVASPEVVTDRDIKPMYQDEWILGYEKVLDDDYILGIQGIYRDIRYVIDDACVVDGWCGLINPGRDVIIGDDADHNGIWDGTYSTLTAEEIGLPKALRWYKAISVQLKQNATNLFWNLSYTWSKSYGNYEGLVKSDTGHDGAGLTTDFDFPELMDGSEGYLPNDRRHTLKFHGAWKATQNLTLGWVASAQSGRPINGFGKGHPNVPGYQLPFGDTYYLYEPATDEFTFVPRGSFGRTPWVYELDVSAEYVMPFAKHSELKFKLDIFNIFNFDREYEVNESAEIYTGTPNINFLAPTSFQSPRTVRIGIEYIY